MNTNYNFCRDISINLDIQSKTAMYYLLPILFLINSVFTLKAHEDKIIRSYQMKPFKLTDFQKENFTIQKIDSNEDGIDAANFDVEKSDLYKTLYTHLSQLENQSFPITNVSDIQMKLIRRGVHRTPEYRLFFKTPDGFISPLHDIPLYSDFENKIFNVIVENQMLEMKKNMKLHLGEALNPLRQITTKRFYPWNDGVFPQTWDNTSELDPQVKHIVGHPMHFMDIGSKDVKRGEIIQVRALGVLGVELKGNMYWKVVVINVRDKKAHRMTDLRHVEENFPGYLQNTVKSYNYWEKTSFAKVRDGKYALKMIEKMHAQWLKMVHGKFKCPGVSKINTCLEGSPNKISCQEAEKEFKKKTKPSQPRPK
ncbi:hypothetical protein WDU94_000368 [Cyamophila willieti]